MLSQSPRVEVYRHSEHKRWSFQDLEARQREIVSGVLKGDPGTLLFSELSPVITLGRRTPESDLTRSPAEYQKKGIEIFKTTRGGLATFHGRWQWVVFPVDRLVSLTGDSRGVRKAIFGILEAMLEVCQSIEKTAKIRHGSELGIWSDSGKLVSVGVEIRDRVLCHGASLNVFYSEESFWGLRPCGMDPSVGYLYPSDVNFTEEEKNLRFEWIRGKVVEAFENVFWKKLNLPTTNS